MINFYKVFGLTTILVGLSAGSALAAKPVVVGLYGEACAPPLRSIFLKYARGTDAREDAVARFLRINPRCGEELAEFRRREDATQVAGVPVDPNNGLGNSGSGEVFVLIPVLAGGAGGGSVSP